MPVARKVISTKLAPAPVGPFSQAIQVGDTLYLSGQIGMTPQGEVVQGIEAQTRLVLDNLGHVLKAAGVSHKNVVKATVLLSDMGNFSTVNKIYAEYFKEPYPARACYQVSVLPLNALVEIEAVAIIGDIVDA